MRVAYFSMADMQSVWENGGQNAYFADETAAAVAPAATAASNNRPGGRGRSRGTGGMVKVTNQRGNTFFRRAGDAIAGAGERGMDMASGGLRGTGKVTGRGLGAAGRGINTAGNFLGDSVRKLGVSASRNPRIAGAVVLGGTALGAGYAYNNRDRGN
jgi:hypothetical protein